ncbi:hypothetical protein ABZ942_28570 [Nocardia sp. NPDC046473]|uniref:hypothetical protein n=1 Tax=Nocardia sp. NPDC046473 TaxID=3155733 RepID=UPI0033E9B417
MAGLIVPRKCALDLVAKTSHERVADAVRWAATVQPPFAQRKLKYRWAVGIGSYDIEPLDVHSAVELHSSSKIPTAAFRVTLSTNDYVDVLLFNDGNYIRAWFRSINTSDRSYNQVVATYPWASALATRTAESLTNAGIINSVETISLRSW